MRKYEEESSIFLESIDRSEGLIRMISGVFVGFYLLL